MSNIRDKRNVRLGALTMMTAGASLLAVVTLLTGCTHENAMGLSDQQQQGINRQHEILRKAGGNWSNVSDSDKEFLIKGTGSEESAKQMVAHQGADGKAPAGQYGLPAAAKDEGKN